MDKREEMQKEFDHLTADLAAVSIMQDRKAMWDVQQKLWALFESSISQARSQAYEECAKIADKYRDFENNWAADIADEIREAANGKHS